MIRLATWLVASLLLTALIAWLIALPGTALIEVAGYRMQPRLGMAIAAHQGIIVAADGAAMKLAQSITLRPSNGR